MPLAIEFSTLAIADIKTEGLWWANSMRCSIITSTFIEKYEELKMFWKWEVGSSLLIYAVIAGGLLVWHFNGLTHWQAEISDPTLLPYYFFIDLNKVVFLNWSWILSYSDVANKSIVSAFY